MPTAPDHLREKFPGGFEEALDVIEPYHTWRNGLIRPKAAGHVETDRERDAIDYAVLEWDFGHDPEPEPQPKTRIVATPRETASREGTMFIPPGDTYVDNETG